MVGKGKVVVDGVEQISRTEDVHINHSGLVASIP